MKTTLLMLINGLLMLTAMNAFASDIKIIANTSVSSTTISVSDLKSVFLLQKRTLRDGSPVVPVLTKSGPSQDLFVRQYLNRETEELQYYYQGLVFTGKTSMPKQLTSDAEVVEYVSKTKGAIGYVNSTSPTEGVKILTVLSEESKFQRTLLKRMEPEYPEALKIRHITGNVRLLLTISPKGSVENVEVVGGNPIFAETAAKAARLWVYSAAPSQTKLEVNIAFEPGP